MSREIKFRAWDPINRVMEYNVNVNQGTPVKQGYQWFNKENTVLHSELMQYTGLKDKNGKEIYEADIDTDEHGNLAVVCYLEKYGAYCFVPVELYLHEDYENEVMYNHGYDCYFDNMTPGKYAEIIGNIYENPELLEVIES